VQMGSSTSIYARDEKIRLFNFVAAYRNMINDPKSYMQEDEFGEGGALHKFQIPEPEGVLIGANGSVMRFALKELERKIEDRRRDGFDVQKANSSAKKSSAKEPSDPVLEYYRAIIVFFKNARDYTSKIGFVASVFMAYAAEYILDCGIEHAPLSRDSKDGPYGVYLYALHDFIIKWDWKDTWPETEEIISFFKTHRPIWPRCQQDDTRNVSERLFELIQELLERWTNESENKKDVTSVWYDADSNVVNCRLDKRDVLNQVCELVRLHGLTQVISPYLQFDVFPRMSSGEMSFLSLFARLYHFVGKVGENENVVVFFDEAETTLHPEWQRRLVTYCIRFFEVFLPRRQYQLVFASHSPMLLADLPKGNVVFLKKEDTSHDEDREEGEDREKECQGCAMENTFAANIFDLYKDSFFLDKGTMGEFAAGKVDKLLKKLNPPMQNTAGKTSDEIREIAKQYQRDLANVEITPDDLKVAKLIGDPFLSRYVWRRLEELSKPVQDPENELIYLRNDDKESSGVGS